MTGGFSALDQMEHLDHIGAMDREIWLNELPHDYQTGFDKLAGLAVRKTFTKNQIIEKQGDPCEYCYLIMSGQVVGYDFTEFGSEHDYFQNETGSSLLETQVLLNLVSPVYFRSVEQSELAVLDRETLIWAMKNDPEVSMYITGNLMTKFDWAIHRIYKTTRSAMWQLCDSLLNLAGKYGISYDNKILITQKISQQALGNQMHINRITVIRNLNELKGLNLIEQINGHYCIRDVDALRKFMESR